jgi:hypothetical protein
MKQLIKTALFFVVCALTVAAQAPKVNDDPKQAQFVTSDIDNFWRAFDLAAKETDREKKIAIYQAEYLDKGSAGLQDFVRLRIKSAKTLSATVEMLPRFYASIRRATLRVKEMEKRMRKSFQNFKKIYPDAVFPNVYFVIGIADTGGTASDNGLLIGTELYGLSPNTERGEFFGYLKSTFLKNETDEKRIRETTDKFLDTALKPVEKLPPIVAHESCHFNQKYPELKTLLAKSIQEGACDFIAEKIAGETINPAQKIYGDQNEAQLWQDFQAEMTGANFRNWMYNGMTVKDKPMDLGYYMGYKISHAYYRQAKNKRQAVRDILETKDFAALLEQSRYREKFAK